MRVSRAQFNIAASGSYSNNVTLSLYVNGTSIQSKSVTGTTTTFDGFNVLINPTNSATLEVKANFAEAYTGGDFQVILPSTGLNAVDGLTSAAVTHAAVAGATFSIGSAGATVSASNSPILSQLFLSPSTSKGIMAFRVQALNDTVKLRDLNFTGTNLDKLSNFRVVDSSNNVVATATTATATAVTFVNISSTTAPSIAKDQVVTYSVLADVNSDTT